MNLSSNKLNSSPKVSNSIIWTLMIMTVLLSTSISLIYSPISIKIFFSLFCAIIAIAVHFTLLRNKRNLVAFIVIGLAVINIGNAYLYCRTNEVVLLSLLYTIITTVLITNKDTVRLIGLLVSFLAISLLTYLDKHHFYAVPEGLTNIQNKIGVSICIGMNLLAVLLWSLSKKHYLLFAENRQH